LGFGGSFGGFDHCCFGFNDLLLNAILTKSISDRYIQEVNREKCFCYSRDK
jgi:hypothetical protein